MNIRRWLITITVCLGILSLLVGFKVFEIQAAIAFSERLPEHSETVEVSIAKPINYQKTITAFGEVLSPKQVDIRNELPGRIVSVNFISGQTVNKGQVLLQLDSSTEQANLVAAKARADLAQTVYQRALRLSQRNAVSQDQLDAAKAELSVITADIQALKTTIAKKTVSSPFDGIVGLHTFEVGQYVEGNTLVTSVVGDTGVMWVDFKVPQIYPELTVGGELLVSRITSNKKTLLQYGVKVKVIAQNTLINSRNRSRHYRAEVDSRLFPLSAHEVVNVKVPVNKIQQFIGVASTAVQHDHLGQYVFKLKQDISNERINVYRAERIEVEVVVQQNGQALLADGIMEGDVVAAAGAFKLYPGILTYSNNRPSRSQVTTQNILKPKSLAQKELMDIEGHL